MTATLLTWAASYLTGAVPFGYLAGRLYGVDLFAAGSRNIGATNAGRVLGRRVGAAVFALDFLKGAVPVAVAPWLAGVIAAAVGGPALPPDVVRVGAAAAAFLGHLYPVTLGFRGGKGVATGAGTAAVVAPGPFLAAISAWSVVTLATRTVSLGSMAAAAMIVFGQLAFTSEPAGAGGVATAYCVAGAALVAVKHRANLARVWAGTESRIGDTAMRRDALAVLHVLAAGLWFGGAAFFSFGAAPPIFASFRDVVDTAPSDRTAGVAIVPEGTPQEQRAALASALAGAAVGPVFPRFFGMQLGCAAVALATALGWRADGRRRVDRVRVWVFAAGLGLVVIGWPLSDHVSAVRLARFSADPAVGMAAKTAFGPWHLASLALSGATTLVAGVGLGLAAWRPAGPAGPGEANRARQ